MATATFTTVADKSVGDTFTEAMWDDMVKDNLNQLASAHRNLLVNGGFEVWQRGAGPFTTTLAYSADRWQLTNGGAGTITVTQETSILDAGASSLKVVTTGNPHTIGQKVEDIAQLRGKTISVSMRVRQSVASGAALSVADSAGSSTNATSATTGSFVTLTATFTVGAAATNLLVTVQFNAAGTYYLDNAMLVIGPAPAPYQPLHPQEDLARCQRYYEIVGGVSGTVYFGIYQAAAAEGVMTVFFKTTKSGTPTITKNGTWAVTNCAQPSVGSPSPGSCTLFSAATALGAMNFSTNSTDDSVSIESNP